MIRNIPLWSMGIWLSCVAVGCTPQQYQSIFGPRPRPYSRPPVRTVQPNSMAKIYYVRSGDTLGTISKKFTGTSKYWRNIAIYNNITDPRRLSVGQRIVIPANITSAARYEGYRSAISVPKPTPRPLKTTPEKTVKTSSKVNPATVTPTVQTPQGYADDIKGWITIGGDQPAEVRAEPNPFSSTIASLKPGARVPWFKKKKQWYRVFTKDGEGYLHEDFIQAMPGNKNAKMVLKKAAPDKENKTAPVASSATSAQEPVKEKAKGILKITGSGPVKAYSEPNPFSSVVKTIYPGTGYDWYEKDKGGWYRIQTSKGPGWVYEEYVKIVE